MISDNSARELTCILVKLRQRDIQFTSNLFVASAAAESKSADELLRTYMNTVYADHKIHMREHDKTLKRELELMAKVEWGSVLSIPKGIEEAARAIAPPNEGERLEDIL